MSSLHTKTPTTPNVTEGIQTAIEAVLQQSKVDHEQILNVSIGTTHFVNAVLERDADACLEWLSLDYVAHTPRRTRRSATCRML